MIYLYIKNIMKNIINTSQFTNDFTPESVYILGLLWADGYTDKKSNRVSIECVKDDIEYFYPIFQTTGDFKLSERHRPNRRLQGTISKSSLELSTFLKENDYGDKSLSSPNKIAGFVPEGDHQSSRQTISVAIKNYQSRQGIFKIWTGTS